MESTLQLNNWDIIKSRYRINCIYCHRKVKWYRIYDSSLFWEHCTDQERKELAMEDSGGSTSSIFEDYVECECGM